MLWLIIKVLVSSRSGITQTVAFSTDCSSTVSGTILSSFSQLIKVYRQTDEFLSFLTTCRTPLYTLNISLPLSENVGKVNHKNNPSEKAQKTITVLKGDYLFLFSNYYWYDSVPSLNLCRICSLNCYEPVQYPSKQKIICFVNYYFDSFIFCWVHELNYAQQTCVGMTSTGLLIWVSGKGGENRRLTCW